MRPEFDQFDHRLTGGKSMYSRLRHEYMNLVGFTERVAGVNAECCILQMKEVDDHNPICLDM